MEQATMKWLPESRAKDLDSKTKRGLKSQKRRADKEKRRAGPPQVIGSV